MRTAKRPKKGNAIADRDLIDGDMEIQDTSRVSVDVDFGTWVTHRRWRISAAYRMKGVRAPQERESGGSRETGIGDRCTSIGS